MNTQSAASLPLMLTLLLAACVCRPATGTPPDLPNTGDVARIDNGAASIGIDRAMGGAIAWLAWRGHPGNTVNIHDPGRLIQQSYYSGQSVDRTADGQHDRWRPWVWNPIQAGGVGSWARVTKLEQKPGEIFCETVPKLWDMPNEEAAAVMRQWTSFEPGMPDVIVVRCEFESRRDPGDRWGDKPLPRHQELPACYFIRSFGTVKSYLGSGKWRDENPSLGPPWSKVVPPQKVVACFDAEGQGVAIFSPASMPEWNYGPVGQGDSSDPKAGPCMHVAPLAALRLGPKCRLGYRFWLVVGTAESMAPRLDALIAKYEREQVEVDDRSKQAEFFTPRRDKKGLHAEPDRIDASLPNVLILGDSISLAYTIPVRESLAGKANVFRPKANCGSTVAGIEHLEQWLGTRTWDVIHFNWGLHDLCYRHPDAKTQGNRDKLKGTQSVAPESYKRNLEALVTRLEATGAALVWASTTVVPEGEVGRHVGDDGKYNAIAAGIMQRHGIPTDDLSTVSKGFAGKHFSGPGDVHFNETGSRKLADSVAASIEAALRSRAAVHRAP